MRPRLVVLPAALLTLVSASCGDGLDQEAEQELETLAAATVRADVKLHVTGSLDR